MATAELFAAEGASVVVADRDLAEARAVAERINAGGGRAVAVGVEVSERGSVVATVDEAKQRFGAVEILVNAAGIVQVLPFTKISPADWQRMLDVHLTGSFLRATPMRRSGTPMDVAQATLYLASDEAGFVTGQVLSPNGGLVM